MTDTDVKVLVRQRDGYKCMKCGMTNDEHVEQRGSQLEVHRLLPGSAYALGWCVTLCIACHGKMARKPIDLFYRSPEENGILLFGLNLFVDDERRCYEAMLRYANLTGKGIGAVLDEVFSDWLAKHPPDYCI